MAEASSLDQDILNAAEILVDLWRDADEILTWDDEGQYIGAVLDLIVAVKARRDALVVMEPVAKVSVAEMLAAILGPTKPSATHCVAEGLPR